MKLLGIFLYLLVLLLIGAAASRRMKDLRDYYAGGKRFGFWAAAFSSRATGESAWLLLGLTGMGAAVGAQALWIVVGEVLGVAAAWTLLCGRFKRLTDRYDSITIPDYLEARLRDSSHRIRLVSAFTLLVFVTIYVSAQIDAIGTAFEAFLGWDYYLGSLVGFSVVLVYIVSGGFVAVVWSDVFQGTLMAIGFYIAIVLSAIMSTVDSLLVLASSAFVRDYYQKVRHPEMSDQELLGRSRTVTFLLAAAALAMAFSVAALVPGRTVFWFAIFGWSGISATFCPTMILSLFWPRLTARGALAGMMTGFACVPFFKFVAPHFPWVGDGLEAVSELPPAFLASGIVAILVSLFDRQGMSTMSGVRAELTAQNTE